MTKPSRFILSSDYATGLNDAKITRTFTIPSSFTVPQNGVYYALDERIAIGEARAGMRLALSSSRWGGQCLINPTNFNLHCKITNTAIGISNEGAMLYGTIYRTGNTVRLRVFLWDEMGAGAVQVTDCGQTLTLGIETFISPFDVKQ